MFFWNSLYVFCKMRQDKDGMSHSETILIEFLRYVRKKKTYDISFDSLIRYHSNKSKILKKPNVLKYISFWKWKKCITPLRNYFISNDLNKNIEHPRYLWILEKKNRRMNNKKTGWFYKRKRIEKTNDWEIYLLKNSHVLNMDSYSIDLDNVKRIIKLKDSDRKMELDMVNDTLKFISKNDRMIYGGFALHLHLLH